MEWVGDNLWVLWLSLAVVFAVVEVMALDRRAGHLAGRR